MKSLGGSSPGAIGWYCRPSRVVSANLRLLDSNSSRAAALVAFSRNNLVVVAAKLETGRLPSVEMLLDVDSTAGTLLGTDGPELREG